ncbi:hypothetical protein AHYW_002006 [Providencia manganoxydans]|uniref:GNAT family N-acetyltransferase n=1 Tax=Providencia manganoxydans TaxID=2923283 RepID=UPI003B9B3374
MKVRLAVISEAERLWFIRNQAIRVGRHESYAQEIIKAWTPNKMPDFYRENIIEHPFFVAVDDDDIPIATGLFDTKRNTFDTIFTLPEYFKSGSGSLIVNALKQEAKRRNVKQLMLKSALNAETFYHRHGFVSIGPLNHYSVLVGKDIPCIGMVLSL